MTFLSMSSRSSVDGAHARCLGGLACDSSWGVRFFFVHVRVMLIISAFTFHYRENRGAHNNSLQYIRPILHSDYR